MDEDLLEVDRLKGELEVVTQAKAEVELREAELIWAKWTVDGKNLKLLVERSSLITECESLTAMVKKLESQITELQQSLMEQEDFSKTVVGERDKARVELDSTRQELVRLQCEALKTFEDGYRDCWNRFASGASADPSANTFEVFLSDLRAKAGRDGAESSNQSPENEA